jgi:hypothetical protein
VLTASAIMAAIVSRSGSSSTGAIVSLTPKT